MSGCVDRAGADSLLLLREVPQLEQEVPLADASLPALVLWQLRPGAIMTVIAPDRTAFRARLTTLSGDEARCVPFERLCQSPESRVTIEVYQALPDKERFELILQKLTELGVVRIVPMQTEHSLTLAVRDAGQRKSHRWPEVLRRAALQCRRARIPALHEAVSFAQALGMAGQAELALLLYEGETGWTLAEGLAADTPRSVALLIGPEGGFSVAERDAAASAGILPVSLGPRILRTETAAIAAAAIVQSRVGDLR